MRRTTARGRSAGEGVRFPVDVSGLSEELGREALEALREAVSRRRWLGGGDERGAAEFGCRASVFAVPA
jgi:hypothetical protein